MIWREQKPMIFRMKVLLLLLCPLVSLLGIAFVLPAYASAFTDSHSFALALSTAPQSEPSISESFGRQLDSLTSLYGTIINVLLVLLAVVAAFASFTIAFVSKAKAAEHAREELKAWRESEEFKALLELQVQRAVEKRISEKMEKLSELAEQMQELYEEKDLEVSAPNDNGNAPAESK